MSSMQSAKILCYVQIMYGQIMAKILVGIKWYNHSGNQHTAFPNLKYNQKALLVIYPFWTTIFTRIFIAAFFIIESH